MLGVLSTVDTEGLPHASPIYYVVDEQFNFFFVTGSKTQKNINIEVQDEAVLTITDKEKNETVQIRGHARVEESLLQSVLGQLASRLNHDLEFMSTLPLLRHKQQSKIVIAIKPYEIRFRKYYDDRLEEETLTVDFS